MNHYYTNNEELESNRTSFKFNYKDHSITFISDNGVFSKEFIDYGSRVMLDHIEINDQKSLLDVGCGYGTFGICLKRIYPQLDVHMVDVNRRALDLARDNAKANNVDVTIYESSVYDEVTGCFDMIVTNPPIRAGKKIVQEILRSSIDHLNDSGELWVVIQKKQGAPSAKKAMEEVFGNCEVIKRDKGYYILMSRKERS